MKKFGEQVITGTATPYNLSFKVGVADGKGGTRFGSEATVAVYGGLGREKELPEVQVGGLSAHDAEFGRQRALAYLRVADLADVITKKLERGLTLLEVFTEVAKGLGLEVHEFVEAGEVKAAQAEEYEEVTA